MKEPQGALAFAGDWHGNDYWATSAIAALRKNNGVDTILHTGDFGSTFTDIDDAEYICRVEKACAINGIMIYFVDGNHDNHPWLWSRPLDEDGLYVVSEHIRCIPRGFRWNWWNKTFFGIGGAVSLDKYWRKEYVSWWPTEEVTYADYIKCVEGGTADVWLSHDCPAGIQIPNVMSNDTNSWPADLLALSQKHRYLLYQIYEIVKPKLIVHGHYHIKYQQQFFETEVRGLDCDGSYLDSNCFVIHTPEELANLTTP